MDDIIRSSNSVTIATISILGAILIALCTLLSLLILISRKIARMITLHSFPRFGVLKKATRRFWRTKRRAAQTQNSATVARPQRVMALHQRPYLNPIHAARIAQKWDTSHEKAWPQRKDLRIPKRIWNRITTGIEKLDALPSWLGPPPVDHMPQETKDGVMGWDWEYAHRSKRITDYSANSGWESNDEHEEFNKPIHYTRYVKMAFPLLIYVLGNDRLPNESEREFIERKIQAGNIIFSHGVSTSLVGPGALGSLPGTGTADERLSEMKLKCLSIFEKAKYGNEEIEKREYLLYMNNLKKIISWYYAQRAPRLNEHEHGIASHFRQFSRHRAGTRGPSRLIPFVGGSRV